MTLFWKSEDGTSEAEILLTGENAVFAQSRSPDGRLLAFTEFHPTTGWDIWVLPVDGNRRTRAFLRTRFAEAEPEFSPDGRWIAYTSNESGRYEISVQPYPGPGSKVQISTEGGLEPAWSPHGREVFYRSGEKIMAVATRLEPQFSQQPLRFCLRDLTFSTPTQNFVNTT